MSLSVPDTLTHRRAHSHTHTHALCCDTHYIDQTHTRTHTHTWEFPRPRRDASGGLRISRNATQVDNYQSRIAAHPRIHAPRFARTPRARHQHPRQHRTRRRVLDSDSRGAVRDKKSLAVLDDAEGTPLKKRRRRTPPTRTQTRRELGMIRALERTKQQRYGTT
jgi:hypothetical protein